MALCVVLPMHRKLSVQPVHRKHINRSASLPETTFAAESDHSAQNCYLSYNAAVLVTVGSVRLAQTYWAVGC